MDPKVEMGIGNLLWSDAGFAINESFKDTLETYFNARASVICCGSPLYMHDPRAHQRHGAVYRSDVEARKLIFMKTLPSLKYISVFLFLLLMGCTLAGSDDDVTERTYPEALDFEFATVVQLKNEIVPPDSLNADIFRELPSVQTNHPFDC